ncbi:hypothetical protein HHI36_001004 [Cryptolaemus montrouzieri]|uniref:Sister chromatid cohesion protein DCC1 n=1 Tax=Cryptolaemus montrouzieri TaxID=559131 RepID=A0ABD2P6E2_9CUCU
MDISNIEKRTFQEIDDVLDLAKLKNEDLLPISQTIYFHESDLNFDNIKLLEVDAHLLAEIQKGKTLIFKGDKDENAVLCSETKTYDINETEISDSLLLMKGMKFNEDCKNIVDRKIVSTEVNAILFNYLEALPGKPYLRKLEKLLNESIYKGPEHEFELNEAKLWTFDELDSIIQSSTCELKEALSNMDAVTIDNKVRLLDFEYHLRVLQYMLKLIDENSWELDEIDYEITLDSLKDIVPSEIVHSLFEKYTEESQVIDGKPHYSYKEKDICILFAKALLSQAGKFSLDEFMQAWRTSVPEGMIPDETMLYGIAIIDRSTTPIGIWAFSESSLPENINARFKVLFEAREKWTVPEIAPYIKKLATEKLDVNALLAKYARAFKIDGVKYYCSKHCK